MTVPRKITVHSVTTDTDFGLETALYNTNEEALQALWDEVDDYVSDLDDERICSEYATFMDCIHLTRTLLKGEPT